MLANGKNFFFFVNPAFWFIFHSQTRCICLRKSHVRLVKTSRLLTWRDVPIFKGPFQPLALFSQFQGAIGKKCELEMGLTRKYIKRQPFSLHRFNGIIKKVFYKPRIESASHSLLKGTSITPAFLCLWVYFNCKLTLAARPQGLGRTCRPQTAAHLEGF